MLLVAHGILLCSYPVGSYLMDRVQMRKREPWWRMMLRPPAVFVLAGFLLWCGFVALSGMGRGLRGPWDFSTMGELGDSFGLLSALMASMAAIFTYQTLADTQLQRMHAEKAAADQKIEADQAKEDLRVEREKADERELERERATKRRDDEQTYFRLLELRLRVLEDVRIGKGETLKVGSDAVAHLVARIESPPWHSDGAVNHELEFSKTYKSNVNDLGHYFRFTYHIILFAKENFGRGAYKYVRLLRAQLSNAEIVMIALNCAYGEGKEKMAPLVERYSLLHNMDRLSRARLAMDRHFKPRAFDPDAKAGEGHREPEDPLAVLAEMQ